MLVFVGASVVARIMMVECKASLWYAANKKTIAGEFFWGRIINMHDPHSSYYHTFTKTH